MTLKAQVQTNFTVADYLKLEQQQGQRFAYYDGKVVPMSGGSISHNRIARNLLSALDQALMPEGKFEVFGSDQKVYLERFNYYLYPDAIVVVSKDIILSDSDAQAIVNPILIIEVASPSTAAYDRGDKFADYQSIPSFQEYVLVRQDRPELSLFYREAPDLWRSRDIQGITAAVHLRSIQLSIPLERIYRQVTW